MSSSGNGDGAGGGEGAGSSAPAWPTEDQIEFVFAAVAAAAERTATLAETMPQLEIAEAQQVMVVEERAKARSDLEHDKQLVQILQEVADLKPAEIDPSTVDVELVLGVLVELADAYADAQSRVQAGSRDILLVQARKELIDKQKAVLAGDLWQSQEEMMLLVDEAAERVQESGMALPPLSSFQFASQQREAEAPLLDLDDEVVLAELAAEAAEAADAEAADEALA